MFPCAGGGGSIVCSSDCCLTFSAIAAPDMTSSATLIRSHAIGKRWREVGRAKVCSRFRTQTVSSLEGGSIGCLVERDWMMLLVLEVLASAQSVVGIGRGCQWGVRTNLCFQKGWRWVTSRHTRQSSKLKVLSELSRDPVVVQR